MSIFQTTIACLYLVVVIFSLAVLIATDEIRRKDVIVILMWPLALTLLAVAPFFKKN